MSMSSEKGSPLDNGYDSLSITRYTFPTESIPQLSVDDPEVLRRMKNALPVVIKNSGLVKTALKWNLEYLQTHLGNGRFYVYASKDNKFKYYDNQRATTSNSIPIPTKRLEVTFSQFISMLRRRWKTKEKVYLQQTLNDSVGKEIAEDFLNFKWDLAHKYQSELGWGALTSNLLLIGLEGNITPAHYDEQENLFTQIHGYKRCILFPPGQFECLYPHPVAHPCDRQSQVDFERPDFERFPKFRLARGLETILGPGDLLYIPMYWWHQIESLTKIHPTNHTLPQKSEDEATTSNGLLPPVTISVNFWYKAASLPERLQFPLTGQQRVSVMRNVEKLLASALGNADEVGNLLRTIVDGRYTDE